MPATPLAIVKQAYAALAAQDIPTYFALADAAVEVHQTDQLPWGGTYHGHEGLRAFTAAMQPLIAPQVAITSFVEAGEVVCALGRTRGTALATQRPFDCALVHVWTVRNGLITRLEAYIETATMRQALGISDAS